VAAAFSAVLVLHVVGQVDAIEEPVAAAAVARERQASRHGRDVAGDLHLRRHVRSLSRRSRQRHRTARFLAASFGRCGRKSI